MVVFRVISIFCVLSIISCFSPRMAETQLCKSIDVRLLSYSNVHIESSVFDNFAESKKFISLLDGFLLTENKIKQYLGSKIETDDIKQFDLVSGFDSENGKAWEDYRNTFLKKLEIYHLGSFTKEKVKYNFIITQDVSLKPNSTFSTIYLLTEVAGFIETIVILGNIDNSNLDYSIHSNTLLKEDGGFVYKDFSNKKEILCLDFKINIYGEVEIGGNSP